MSAVIWAYWMMSHLVLWSTACLYWALRIRKSGWNKSYKYWGKILVCVLSVAYSLHIVVNICTSTKLIHSVKCMSIYKVATTLSRFNAKLQLYVHFNFWAFRTIFWGWDLLFVNIFSIVVKRMNKKVLTTLD